MPSRSLLPLFVPALALAVAALDPAAAAEPVTTAAPLPPKEAGARYGQALGASLVCPNARLAPAAEALMARYGGADLDAFKETAQRVTLVWKKTLGCDARADINRCRLLNEISCGEALREIGPAGSQLPGLIDPK